MRLKSDDVVIVLSGDFSGHEPARILSINKSKSTAYIEGVGGALKHVKRGHPKSAQGGRVMIPSAVQLSKIALYCVKCERGVRVKRRLVNDVKQRVCGQCGQSL